MADGGPWWAKRATGPVQLETMSSGFWAGSRVAGEGLIQFFSLWNVGGPGRGLSLVISGTAIERGIVVPASAQVEVRPRRKRSEIASFERHGEAWRVELPEEDIRAGFVIARDVELRRKLGIDEAGPAFDALQKNHIDFSIQGARHAGEGELTTRVVAGDSEPWVRTEHFKITDTPQSPPRSSDPER